MKKTYTAFACEQEQIERIDEIAENEHLTKSDILRRAVREFISNYELTK